MMASVCLSSLCHMPSPNSRTERPRKPKIGKMEAHHTGNPRTCLEVKRSKVKVTRPINDVTDNAPSFLKISLLELSQCCLQMQHHSIIGEMARFVQL